MSLCSYVLFAFFKIHLRGTPLNQNHIAMKKSIIYFLYGLLFILVHGCNDDETPTIMDDDNPPVETPCLAALDSLTVPAVNVDTMLNLDDCPLSWVEFYPEKYRYTYPCFNPNNVEELAFIRLEWQTLKRDLCILDLCSGELNCLDVNPVDDLDWGANNWLLFIGEGLQLWKVRPDGSGLTQLTTAGENDNPIWEPEGKRVVYRRTNSPGYFFMLDDNGAVLDTIEKMQAKTAFDWSMDNKLITPTLPLTPDSYCIGYYDMAIDSIITTNDIGGQYYIYDAKWGENNRLYWLLQYRLSHTDIETGGQADLFSLPNGFNNRFYRSLTISPGNKYIVLNREDWKQLNECDVEVVHSLYIMGMDGTDERKILMPE